jgi:hypothetical protein
MGEEALARMRELMGKLKLTVNEEKTRSCKVPEGEINFLGYMFGRLLVEASARPAYTTSPFNIPNHIRHHMRYVVPACGGLTEIPTEFQSLPCGPFDHLDVLAQPIRLRSPGFSVSPRVRSSLPRLSAR